MSSNYNAESVTMAMVGSLVMAVVASTPPMSMGDSTNTMMMSIHVLLAAKLMSNETIAALVANLSYFFLGFLKKKNKLEKKQKQKKNPTQKKMIRCVT